MQHTRNPELFQVLLADVSYETLLSSFFLNSFKIIQLKHFLQFSPAVDLKINLSLNQVGNLIPERKKE